jgi:hypothetical protein
MKHYGNVLLVIILAFGPSTLNGLKRPRPSFNEKGQQVPESSASTIRNISQHLLNRDWGKLERQSRNLMQLSTGPDSIPGTIHDGCRVKSLFQSCHLCVHYYFSGNSDDVCVKPACVTSAASILESLDLRVDPCQDFYTFACGSWIDQAVIPENENRHSVMSEIALQNTFQIHKALSSLGFDDGKDATKDEEMTKNFYQSN